MTDTLVSSQAHMDQLLHLATERIEIAYIKSVRKGIKNPAVFVLELTDPTARMMIRRIGRDEEAERLLTQDLDENMTPIATWYESAEVAANLLPSDHVAAAEALRTWATFGPPGSIPVIVVGAGIIGLVAFPTP